MKSKLFYAHSIGLWLRYGNACCVTMATSAALLKGDLFSLGIHYEGVLLSSADAHLQLLQILHLYACSYLTEVIFHAENLPLPAFFTVPNDLCYQVSSLEFTTACNVTWYVFIIPMPEKVNKQVSIFFIVPDARLPSGVHTPTFNSCSVFSDPFRACNGLPVGNPFDSSQRSWISWCPGGLGFQVAL